MEWKRFEDLNPDEVRVFVERVVADAGPKPLSEWTESELKGEIFDGHMDAVEALDELLRRKEQETIERCVGLIRASASGYREVQSIETSGSGKAVAAGKAGVLEDIANYIERMQ